MSPKLFDSHAHYDSREFDRDRDLLLQDLHKNQNIGAIVNVGTNVSSSKKSLELARKYDFVYAAAGIHPHDAKEASEHALAEIRALSHMEKIVAIGEIGLDYHYDFSPRKDQKEAFARQMDLASEEDLPVILHEREAWADTIDIVRPRKNRGVFHCFSGSRETAKIALDLGYMISLTGVLTFKNAKKPIEVASYVPLERLMLETDCPYMAPEPFRGKRNHSGYMMKTAEKIAEVKRIDVDEVIETTARNASLFFRLESEGR